MAARRFTPNAYPEPAGYAEAKLRTQGAFYDQNLKEFILSYDDVRKRTIPTRR